MDLDRRARWLALAVDGGLSLAVLALGLVRDAGRIAPEPGQMTAPYLLEAPAWALVATHVVGALVLLLRRNRTVLAAVVLAGLALVAPVVAALVMPYSVARYVPGLRRSLPVCVVLAVAVLAGAGHADALVRRDLRVGEAVTPLLVMTCLTIAGLYFRARTDLVEQLRARADAAERESRLRAERERLKDRAALALVLHDVGAHWVTLMTMQAGALSVQAVDPGVRAEAEDLRVKGERALVELHRLIGVLSSGGEEAEWPDAPSGRFSLSALVAECSPGLRVDFEEHGTGASAPEATVVLLRRVLAEGLLNAVKHAAGGSAVVTVSWHAEHVDGTVVSRSGPEPSRLPTPGVGSRVGLAGLATRCADVGGQLDSGTRDDGAFVVRAHLPYRRTP